MSDGVAISIKNVSKNFRLPHEKTGSIKSSVVNAFRKKDKKFETQRALKDISFEIKKGEFFGIVGRNGSGKSTLLKILAEIYQPTKGSVNVNGKLVPFIELGVGFNPELTGRENVYLNGALLGFSKKQIAARYNDIVEFAELEDFMDQKLKNYSSGMQVRLAFSVATRAEADILLVDEVLAVGDAAFQKKCFNYFMDLKRQKKMVILVTHDMEAVRQYCDAAILIEKGVIKTSGSPDMVAEQYLKLFSAKNDKQDGVSDRWGSRQAYYTKPSVSIDKNNIKIASVLNVKADIDNPLIGFSIENGAGNKILGTNNELERKNLSDLKKGQSLKVSWSIPNILTNGEYRISLTIEQKGASQAVDWWNGAGLFTIDKPHPTPYVVYPSYDLDVKDEAAGA